MKPLSLAPLALFLCLTHPAIAHGPSAFPALLNTNGDGDTEADLNPAITADGFGGFVAVWSTAENISGAGNDSDIAISRSADGGITWSPPQILNSNAAGDTGSDTRPVIASDRASHLVAVWQSTENLSGAGTDPDILVARSADNGMTWSAPAVLNSNATGNSGFTVKEPKLATDGAGTWIVCWTSTDDLGGIGSDQDILHSISTDLGETWSPAAALNSDAASDGGNSDFNPDIHANRDGLWIATWAFDDSEGDIMESRSTDGGQTWSPQQGLHGTGFANDGQDFFPSVHVGVHGKAMIVWESGSSLNGSIDNDQDILHCVSDDGGVSWSLPAPVNANAGSDTELDSVPSVTGDESGNRVVVWNTGNVLYPTLGMDADVVAACLPAGSGTWSAPLPVARNADNDSGSDLNARAAINDSGNLVVVWQSDENLATTAGSDFDLFVVALPRAVFWGPAAVLNSNAAADTTPDFFPEIASDGASTRIAVWASNENVGGTAGTDRDIYFSRSADAGQTWSPLALLNTNGNTDLVTDLDTDPDVAYLGQGEWAAIWVSNVNLNNLLGDDQDILISRSIDDGVTWSPPAALSPDAGNDGNNSDFDPTLASDGAGNLIAVWNVDALFGADNDIAYSISADGGMSWSTPAAMNPGAAVDASDEFDSTVATGGHGTWIATWFSNNPTGGIGASLLSDDDLIYRRSTDNGITWSAGDLLNTNAAADLAGDDDMRPRLASDGQGNWVAAWHLEGGSFEGTPGDDTDTLVARSSDDGLTWSAPIALQTRAGETGQEFPPRVATTGDGLWAVVWTAVDPAVGGEDLASPQLDDSEVLCSFSFDLGATWMEPFALNSYAAVDSGNESFPALIRGSRSQLLAVWSGTANLGGGIGTDQDLFVSALDLPDHYERWLRRHFDLADLANPTLEATLWGEDADADTDRAVTLLEYFQRRDPLRADGAGAVAVRFVAPGLLEIAYRKSKDPNLAVVSDVEWSENLVTWKKSGEMHSSGAVVDITLHVPTDAGDHVLVRARTNVVNIGHLFLRLVVSRP